LRYYYESVQGASFARRRAIEEANASLIGFLDDDNVPDTYWVRAAVDFARTHSRAAAFGSQIHGKLEVPPPRHFDQVAGFLPIVERTHTVCFTEGNYNKFNMLPPGAGLVIRRQLWLDLVPKHQTLLGPVGQSLAQKGEDLEALMYLKRAGWEIWYNADMHIYHYIPASRLEQEYFVHFFRGIGLGRYQTRMVTIPTWHKPFLIAAYMVNDLYKLGKYWLKYRREISTDTILASKLELYRSSLISPLYHLKITYLLPIFQACQARLQDLRCHLPLQKNSPISSESSKSKK
jgi:GT2 family glycosyltransferase